MTAISNQSQITSQIIFAHKNAINRYNTYVQKVKLNSNLGFQTVHSSALEKAQSFDSWFGSDVGRFCFRVRHFWNISKAEMERANEIETVINTLLDEYNKEISEINSKIETHTSLLERHKNLKSNLINKQSLLQDKLSLLEKKSPLRSEIKIEKLLLEKQTQFLIDKNNRFLYHFNRFNELEERASNEIIRLHYERLDQDGVKNEMQNIEKELFPNSDHNDVLNIMRQKLANKTPGFTNNDFTDNDCEMELSTLLVAEMTKKIKLKYKDLIVQNIKKDQSSKLNSNQIHFFCNILEDIYNNNNFAIINSYAKYTKDYYSNVVINKSQSTNPIATQGLKKASDNASEKLSILLTQDEMLKKYFDDYFSQFPSCMEDLEIQSRNTSIEKIMSKNTDLLLLYKNCNCIQEGIKFYDTMINSFDDEITKLNKDKIQLINSMKTNIQNKLAQKFKDLTINAKDLEEKNNFKIDLEFKDTKSKISIFVYKDNVLPYSKTLPISKIGIHR